MPPNLVLKSEWNIQIFDGDPVHKMEGALLPIVINPAAVNSEQIRMGNLFTAFQQITKVINIVLIDVEHLIDFGSFGIDHHVTSITAVF